MTACKNEKQIQIGKVSLLSQAFSFSAKVGFDSELKNSNFLREIGLFNIAKCFQFIPRIEDSFAIPRVLNLKSGGTTFLVDISNPFYQRSNFKYLK